MTDKLTVERIQNGFLIRLQTGDIKGPVTNAYHSIEEVIAPNLLHSRARQGHLGELRHPQPQPHRGEPRMSRHRNQYWVAMTPDGEIITRLLPKRKDAREAWCSSEYHWRIWYRRGFRCVKVWVYQEPAAKELQDVKAAIREFQGQILFVDLPKKVLDAFDVLEKAAFDKDYERGAREAIAKAKKGAPGKPAGRECAECGRALDFWERYWDNDAKKMFCHVCFGARKPEHPDA